MQARSWAKSYARCLKSKVEGWVKVLFRGQVGVKSKLQASGRRSNVGLKVRSKARSESEVSDRRSDVWSGLGLRSVVRSKSLGVRGQEDQQSKANPKIRVFAGKAHVQVSVFRTL